MDTFNTMQRLGKVMQPYIHSLSGDTYLDPLLALSLSLIEQQPSLYDHSHKHVQADQKGHRGSNGIQSDNQLTKETTLDRFCFFIRYASFLLVLGSKQNGSGRNWPTSSRLENAYDAWLLPRALM